MPVRRRDERGVATGELISVGGLPVGDADDRPLFVDLVTDGEIATEYTGAEGVQAAREHCAAVLRELPRTARRLGKGDPAINTYFVHPDGTMERD